MCKAHSTEKAAKVLPENLPLRWKKSRQTRFRAGKLSRRRKTHTSPENHTRWKIHKIAAGIYLPEIVSHRCRGASLMSLYNIYTKRISGDYMVLPVYSCGREDYTKG